MAQGTHWALAAKQAFLPYDSRLTFFSHVEDSKYYLLRESPSLGVAEHGSGASLDVAREVRSRVLVRNFSQVSQGALFVVSVTALVNKSVSWQGIVNLPG